MDIIQVNARASASGQGTIAGVTGTNAPGSMPGGKPTGYVPQPPPPPAPVSLVEAHIDVSNNGPLVITFSGPVSGSNPFAQDHPWILTANGDPQTISISWSGTGYAQWTFIAGSTDSPVLITVPALTELPVVPGVYPVTLL